MADDWPQVTIEQVAADKPNAMSMGPFGSRIKTDNFVDAGVPIIRGETLNAYRFRDDDFRFLTEEKANELKSANAFPGDVVVTHRGTLGQVGIIPRKARYPRYVISQSHMKVTCDERQMVPEFLFYYLKSPEGQHRLLANTAQTGVPAIARPLTSLKAIEVPRPPLHEQRAIARILGTLDDKIELNRRMNETLEAVARALFKSWFVDFDPVRAKAEGRKTGLPPEIDALFPDGFEETEIGEVPRGWGVGVLASIAALNPESWTKANRPALIQYVDLSNTKWGRIESVAVHEAGAAPSRAQRVLRPGDTIVGTVRPGNGSYAFVNQDGLTGSTGFAVLRAASKHDPEFVYLAATAPENIEALSHLADGGAYPAVRPEVIAATPVVVPLYGIRAVFSKLVHPLLLRIAQSEEGSRVLTEVRDDLLPKLISGNLRMPASQEVPA